jgi:hypothetical protein
MTEMPSGEEDENAAVPPGVPKSQPDAVPLPEAEPVPPAEPVPAAEPAPMRRRSGRQAVLWLSALLAVVVVVAGSAPFWAPGVVPLLPWRPSPATPSGGSAALAARFEAVDRRMATADDALTRVQSRVAALTQRLEPLEAAEGPHAAGAGAVQQLRQDVDRLGTEIVRLGDRIGALEAKIAAQANAGSSEATLLVSLIELREAVAAGRPFVAEYQGFAALARGRPDLEAAVAPLAQSAASGIATTAELRHELSEIDARLAAGPTRPAPPREWWRQALSRMQGLVTIRRIGTPQTGPRAAVVAAQAALATGGLAAAVNNLAALSGREAEAVRDWLPQARARLAAEAALSRLQQLLTAQLGAEPVGEPKAGPANGSPLARPKPGAPS